MMLNAEQLRTTAQKWYRLQGVFPSGYWAGDSYTLEHVGDGPYHLLVALDPAEASYNSRVALGAFAGVAIPNLSQLTREVRTGHMSLHVVPHMVYNLLIEHTGYRFMLDTALEPPRFVLPPTEADMEAVFLDAMSVHSPPPGSPPLAVCQGTDAVIRQACERLGWRTVAALVNTMNQSTTSSVDDVAAALAALASPPASAG